MKAEQLLDAFGEIDDNTIREAKRQQPQRRSKPWQRWALSAACLILAITLLLQTAPGQAMAAYIQENLIQKLFPPIVTQQTVEGLTEPSPQQAFGEVTDWEQPAAATDGLAQYAIYIDEAYVTEQHDNCLRASFPMDAEAAGEAALPETYLEVTQIRDITPEQLAEQLLAEQESLGQLALVSRTEPTADLPYLVLHYQQGVEYNSAIVTYYLRDNGCGGAFQITLQTFQEAAEGHGARLAQAVSTLQILDDADLAAGQ